MSFSPTAVLLMRLLGPALTRAVLTRLLRDEIRGGDIAGTLTGSLNIPGLVEQLGGDYAQARQAQRFFEEIGDKAAAGVARTFERDYGHQLAHGWTG
ncbi:MAG: hypothetical protein R6X32_11430 [Chloroflexota bacterium]